MFEEDIADLFTFVEPGEGDEFAAVKPWLGAIREPEVHPPFDPSPPEEDYKIDFVFGFRTEETRMNLHFNNNGQLVYPTAALGIIYDYKKKEQIFFGGGKTKFSARKQEDETKGASHTDDITALAISDSRKLIASGQNGKTPIIYVWKSDTAEMVKKMKLPKGARLVTAIGISANDKYVAAADATDDHYVHILDIAKGHIVADVQIGYSVKHLDWHPTNENIFCTAGEDHMYFCEYMPMKSKVKKDRVMTKGKGNVSFTSMAWSTKNPEYTFGAGGDGKLHFLKNAQIFESLSLSKETGAIQSVLCAP